MPAGVVDAMGQGVDLHPAAVDIHPTHHMVRIAVPADIDIAHVIETLQEMPDVCFPYQDNR